MEKIIQLEYWEYEKLVNESELKEYEIIELAEKMYEEKGTFNLNIRFNFSDDYDWNMGFSCSGDINDDKTFKIPVDSKKESSVMQNVVSSNSWKRNSIGNLEIFTH